jgi:hypothetical protein
MKFKWSWEKALAIRTSVKSWRTYAYSKALSIQKEGWPPLPLRCLWVKYKATSAGSSLQGVSSLHTRNSQTDMYKRIT